jgi:hypothetical protein
MRCNMFRRKNAEGLFFRHPGLAQALDKPGQPPVRGWCERCLDCRDALDLTDHNVTFGRVTGLRLMSG